MPDEATPSPLGGFVRVPAAGPADRRVSGGSGNGFAFTLSPAVAGAPVAERLDILFEGEIAWTTGSNPIATDAWRAFLVGLSASWMPLRVRQSYPGGVTPRRPSLTFDAILREVINAEQAKGTFEAFRSQHDVSAWFQTSGLKLPPLLLVREGRAMLAEAGDRLLRWHAADTLRTLERLGDVICGRLDALGGNQAPVEAWAAREDGATDEALDALDLGVSVERVRGFVRAGIFARPANRNEVLSGLDEVRVAARMLAARVDDDEVAKVASLIRGQDHRPTPELDALTVEAKPVLDATARDLPRVQGQKLAQWLRERIDTPPNVQVDPEALLSSWGVSVVPFETDPRIEAVCFWGASHGPAVLLNTRGRSNRKPANVAWAGVSGGARATLAHEICHLLVDRQGALPAAEVLGGSVPYAPEERARAFAAEFLLPQETAGQIYRSRASAAAAVATLVREFRVSRTVAAWQVLNRFGSNEAMLPSSERRYLLDVADPNRRAQREGTAALFAVA
ncbi:hypothetical protein FHR71_003931 [Methylobacterium sp. RAS18]|nr:hypothetical protein [Methylobacterium sp. RAS18]